MPHPEIKLPSLKLKRREERRMKAGHLWVFSNEIDIRATPLRNFTPGELIRVDSHDGRFIGYGYVNPNSLICARLLSTEPKMIPDTGLLTDRIGAALRLRQRLYDEHCYRLIFGESDGLPGLVVDRYEDILVVQLTTAGMEAMKLNVIEALEKTIKPTGILLRNDLPVRALEGLKLYSEVASGNVPDEAHVRENEVMFRVPLTGGQKTGWYYDQRDNRSRLRRYVAGARVLDLFSYVGAWGLIAARHGATEVHCVDSSAAALELLRANAAVNHLDVSVTQGDAFDVLAALADSRRRFDIIVLDPPAFIPRRKDKPRGRAAYRRLNRQAMQLLAEDALLVSCSCSHHLTEDELISEINRAARQLGRRIQILERGGQAADHPVHPVIPETRYLKSLFCRVTGF